MWGLCSQSGHGLLWEVGCPGPHAAGDFSVWPKSFAEEVLQHPIKSK